MSLAKDCCLKKASSLTFNVDCDAIGEIRERGARQVVVMKAGMKEI